jgi:hypothetical protein
MTLFNLDVEDFPKDFDWHNDQFPPLDALTYWHFLKKANKVIEIGCGYSTLISKNANVNLIAVDPNPRKIYPNIEYIFKQIQNVDLTLFDELNEDDILFIDSSHIYSQGSDVHFLIHQGLPRLKKGVVIHFHDYFGQEGYPIDWQQNETMREWNENSKLIELIEKYDVLCANYNISKNHNDKLKEIYSFVPSDISNNLGAVRGASLWLKNL